ncbi:MAG: topoisomerase DNA-binding C4 zinc finger domain-containing protein, partial [Candidatus Woesearchaeota archaeon]|nr:topoisomerase DNA-binding C4 zinc finger domain-containing protein [Candidatus Woesearchaeota archaeon]
IIQNLIDRHYLDGKTMMVSEIGLKTIETLEKYCPEIVSEELTKHFEEEMDEIRAKTKSPEETLDEAKLELTKILEHFKKNELNIGKELAQSLKDTDKIKNTICPCNVCKKGNLVMKFSKKTKQRFIACDQYPDCKTIFNAPQQGDIKATDKICEHCGFAIVEVRNKKNAQVYCVNSACKTRAVAESKEKKYPEEGIECPVCKKGKMVLRKSFYGEFLGCNNYPDCKTMMKMVNGKVDQTPISGNKTPAKKK